MPEVAPFGIGITLVEPGNVRTEFGAALSVADPIDAYTDGPVGQVRRYIEESDGNLTGGALGDPKKVAAAIITAAAEPVMPRRTALGSDSYQAMHAALTARLGELDAGRELAVTTDFPKGS